MGKKEKKKTPQAWEEGTRSQLADIRAHVNTAFDKYYGDGQLGLSPEEYTQFVAILRTPLPVTFRLSGCPSSTHALALRDAMVAEYVPTLRAALPSPPQPLPWYPAQLAWQFDVSRAELRGKGAAADAPPPAGAATLAAFHAWLLDGTETGRVQRQELVSMVPTLLLGVAPGHRVLDMCASPGSKTQQLIEWLDGRGLVVANDADRKRCHLMVSRASKLLSPLLFAVNHDARLLPEELTGADGITAPWRFDRVLCDVPCSGDGTLRKAPELWRRWSPRLGYGVHRVQLNLLLRGLQLLVAGGRLVYSTCSLNPIEDEAVVAHALLAFAKDEKYTTAAGEPAVRLLPSAGDLLPGLKRTAGVSSWKVRHEGGAGDDGSAAGFVTTYDELPADANAEGKIVPTMFAPPAADAAALHLDRCMRVLPHQQDTGGFFIAVFERLPTAADAAPAEPPAAAEAPAAAEPPAEAPADPPAAPEAEQATEKASAAAAHVGAALHLSPTNHGRYDALYRLTPAFAEQLAAFFGLGAAFPRDQLVSRSKQGKSIFFVERALLQLLRADERTKLRIVNTGARVLERLETAGAAFGFRLAQEGLPCVLPHMTRQLCFASTADLRQLLRRRRVDALDFASAAMRAAVAAAQPGSLVVVHDPRGRGALVAGEPLPLAIAAMRSGGHAPRVDCLVKKAETNVMFLRLDADEAAARA